MLNAPANQEFATILFENFTHFSDASQHQRLQALKKTLERKLLKETFISFQEPIFQSIK